MDASPRLASLVLALAGFPLLGCNGGTKPSDDTDAVSTDLSPDTDVPDTDTGLLDTAVLVDTDVDETDALPDTGDTDPGGTDGVDSDTDVVETDVADTDTDIVVDTDTDPAVCDPSAATYTGEICFSYIDASAPCPDPATVFSDPPPCWDSDYDLVPGCDVTSTRRIDGVDTGIWSSGDSCCYTAPLIFIDGPSCAIGRPLRVRGRATAPRVRMGRHVSRPRASARVVRAWTDIARLEQSAVPAFARAERLLRVWGAPAELIAATVRAREDEERHAVAAFGIASRLGGVVLSPEPLVDPGDVPTPVAFALETLRDAAVGELVSVAQAAVAWRHASVAEIRAQLATVVREESQHAQLGLATVAWLASSWPEVREAVLAALNGVCDGEATLPPDAGGDAHARAFGLPDADVLRAAGVQARALARTLVREALAA